MSEETKNTEVTQQDLDTCKQQLTEAQVQMQEWKDKCMRVTADFENYKKRVLKEQNQFQYMMQANMLEGLLAIVDNFDRGFEQKETQELAQKNPELLVGFELIRKELHKYLEQQGVQEIKYQQDFDPELFEAVMQVASDTHPAGAVVQILQKGYIIKDRVLRPAKVSVAQ